MPLHGPGPAGFRGGLLRPFRSGHQRGVLCPLVGAAEADPSRIMEASTAGAMQIQKHLRLEPTKYLEGKKKRPFFVELDERREWDTPAHLLSSSHLLDAVAPMDNPTEN